MKQWIKKLLAKIADKYPKLQENILQDIRLQKSRFLLASVYCLHNLCFCGPGGVQVTFNGIDHLSF